MTDRIEKAAAEEGAGLAERIPYDRAVTAAQMNKKSVVEFGNSAAAKSIKEVWERVCRKIL